MSTGEASPLVASNLERVSYSFAVARLASVALPNKPLVPTRNGEALLLTVTAAAFAMQFSAGC